MKAYAIVIEGNEISELGFERLVKSSEKVGNNFTVERINAVTPDNVDELMSAHLVKWNYPWEGEVIDFASGLKKTAYKTANPKARIACAMSHYLIWLTASIIDKPIVVLEHDAYFINKIDFDIADTKAWIMGINNPLGVTRKSAKYYDSIRDNPSKFQLVPWIDDQSIPQGLAGNSAYIITREGANRMLYLVSQFGLWPNDALMCRQLVPNLYVTKKYYTHCQQLKSTTTL